MRGVYFQKLDFDKMNEAANTLFEYTDFTSFSKLHTDVKTNNCKIMAAHWEQLSSRRVGIYHSGRQILA